MSRSGSASGQCRRLSGPYLQFYLDLEGPRALGDLGARWGKSIKKPFQPREKLEERPLQPQHEHEGEPEEEEEEEEDQETKRLRIRRWKAVLKFFQKTMLQKRKKSLVGNRKSHLKK